MDASTIIEFRRIESLNDSEGEFIFRTTKEEIEKNLKTGEFDLWKGDIFSIQTDEGIKKHKVLRVKYNPLNDNKRVYFVSALEN